MSNFISPWRPNGSVFVSASPSDDFVDCATSLSVGLAYSVAYVSPAYAWQRASGVNKQPVCPILEGTHTNKRKGMAAITSAPSAVAFDVSNLGKRRHTKLERRRAPQGNRKDNES